MTRTINRMTVSSGDTSRIDPRHLYTDSLNPYAILDSLDTTDMYQFMLDSKKIHPTKPPPLPPIRNDDMSDDEYFKIVDDLVILYNWINPKSPNRMQFTFNLSNTSFSAASMQDFMRQVIAYFRDDYGSPEVAEKKVKNSSFIVKEDISSNEIVTTASLPAHVLEFLITKLSQQSVDLRIRQAAYLVKLEDTIRGKLVHPSHIYNTIWSMQEYELRSKSVDEVVDKLKKINSGELKEAYFHETGAMFDYILKGFTDLLSKSGSISSIKNATDKETRWQFKLSAMLKRLGHDINHASIHGAELRKVYNNESREKKSVNSYIRIVKYSVPENSNRNIGLKILYPEFKAAVRNLKREYVSIKFRSLSLSTVDIDFNSMIHFWTRFNAMKNRLMLLGYSEYKATHMLSLSIFKTSIGMCEITKQFVPAVFLVPLLNLKEEKLMVNAVYLNTQDNHGHYSGRMRKYDWSNEKYVKELKLPDDMYYVSGVRNHTYNPIEYLSVRSMSTENVMVHGNNRVYRPVPYLGIELEVERKEQMRMETRVIRDMSGNATSVNIPVSVPNTCSETITENVYESLGRDYIVLKRDGSLRGYNPFEIVTVPATLQYHQMRWDKFLSDKTLKDQLQSYQSGNCGMHVHISRDSFNGLHLAKFMRFINSKDNHNFITKIAQRTSNRYAEYKDASIREHLNDIHNERNDRTRRVAVNCTNPNTIEVRIFRGNLAKVSFLKNLEFVHALWMYTKDASMQDLSYKKFLFWLFNTNNDVKFYKHLKVWLVSSGFNVSNNIIRTGTPENEAIKLKEERKKIKKIQLIVNRKYQTKESVVKFGGASLINKEEILASA